MKFASLFTGIGGFDLGFEQAGMSCVLQVERDKYAAALLARRWPDVRRMDDVRDVTADDVSAAELICGGFPCQDVSVAKRGREGLAGKRSGLWFEFHRILTEAKPRWVVIENVPGLLSSNDGRDFAVILTGLVECGYRVAWRVLDAQHFGVAQRRRRVFVVGYLGDGRAAQVLFEREGVSGHSQPRQEAGQAASRVVGTLAASGAGTAQPAGQKNELDLLIPTFSYTSFGSYTADSHSRTLSARGFKSPENLYVPPIASALTRSYEKNIDNERSKGFNAVGYVNGVRRLTPVECERLQGFPDAWTDGQSDAQRYRQLGNAVCVSVARWLGERIMQAEVQR